MTTPSVVFFGYDHSPNPTAKVFIRTLLYSTAARGVVIEKMYISIVSNERSRVFSFWGYDEKENLTVGSGLYVGQSGLSANHHFVSSKLEEFYDFGSGYYTITVYAQVFGRRRPKKLKTIQLTLSDDLANALASYEGVLFEQTIEGDYQGSTRLS